MENTNLIKSYKDLRVWQKAHAVAMEVLHIFRQTKRDFSTYEIWKQAISAVFSVPANIVEGYYSHKGANFAAKLNVAKGEAGETDYWLFVLSEISVITEKKYSELSDSIVEIIKMLSGLRNKIRR